MKKLALAYFGSPQFSADFLEKLLTDRSINQIVTVKLVVTQEDKPVGRKQVLTPTPVKIMALKYGLEVLEIKNLKLKIKNFDLALIYFYGQIIPKNVLALPKYGFWNIHFSLLPKYRGPAPLVAALISGESQTGISIVQTDDKLDHGDLVAQQEVPIHPEETKIELEKRLGDISFDIFKKEIKNLLEEKIQLIPQDHKRTTYARFPTKQDGFVPFENFKFKIQNSPEKLYNLFRGLYPWPGIWTLLRQDFGGRALQKRLKITDLEFTKGKLIIKKVQLEGKKEVDFRTFNKAYKLF